MGLLRARSREVPPRTPLTVRSETFVMWSFCENNQSGLNTGKFQLPVPMPQHTTLTSSRNVHSDQ
jgi:hypothetical protein